MGSNLINIPAPEEDTPHYHEGSITLIRGKQRAGKSLLLSIFARNAYDNNRTVFTNLPYTFPYEPLYYEDLDLNDQSVTTLIRNGVVTLDELSMILDARSSMSKERIKFSRWLYQVKKQGVDLFGTIHSLRLTDVRMRENHDWLIDVQSLPINRPPGEPPTHIILQIQNGPLQEPTSLRRVIALPESLIGMYDQSRAFDPSVLPKDR